jgi:hypothetical protein
MSKIVVDYSACLVSVEGDLVQLTVYSLDGQVYIIVLPISLFTHVMEDWFDDHS